MKLLDEYVVRMVKYGGHLYQRHSKGSVFKWFEVSIRGDDWTNMFLYELAYHDSQWLESVWQEVIIRDDTEGYFKRIDAMAEDRSPRQDLSTKEFGSNS